MAFSQETWSGQGLSIGGGGQRDRSGELLAAGISSAGESLGRGIAAYKANKSEAKGLRVKLGGWGESFNMEEKDWKNKLEDMSLSELQGMGERITMRQATQLHEAILAEYQQKQDKADQEGKFYAGLAKAGQTGQVAKDYSGEVSAAEKALMGAKKADPGNGFRGDITYSAPPAETSSMAPVYEANPYMTMPEQAFIDNPREIKEQAAVDPNAWRNPWGKSEMPAGAAPFQSWKERRGQAPEEEQAAPSQLFNPAPVEGVERGPEALPGPSEAVVNAENDLAMLKAEAAKGGTRDETPQEVNERLAGAIPKLMEENPTMAKEGYDLLFPKADKLTIPNRIAILNYERDIQASTVAGFGVAGSAQIAKEFREVLTDATKAQQGVTRLLEINDTPGAWADLDMRKEAQTIQGLLQGALRREIVGPGAVTEMEQKLLKSIIADPTKFWSLKGRNRKSLETLLEKVTASIDINASNIQWSQKPTAESWQGRKTYSYGADGKLANKQQ